MSETVRNYEEEEEEGCMYCGKEGGTAGEDKSTEGSPQKKIKLGADPFSHLLHQNVGRNWGRSKEKSASTSGGPLTFKMSALYLQS